MKTISTSHIRTRSAGYTRPSDTNAYTAGDVVANSTSAATILTFAGATLGKLGSTILMSATCVTSASVAAAKPDLQLWLFDTTITMDQDNAVFTPTDAELLTLLHIVSFPVAAFVVGDATAGAGGNAVCNAQNLWLPINTVIADNSIYGVLVVRNAYAPVSAETINVRLGFVD